jgi:phosphatase NudJ
MNRPVFSPHVTVAAVVEEHGRFLVVREYVEGIERINNPAGHVEDGESPFDAVVREVYEETGYRFTPEALGGVYVWRDSAGGDTFVRFNFIGRCTERNPAARLDDGIIGPVWLAPEELESRESALRSPLVLRSVREHLAGVRYPLVAVTALIEP